MPTRKYDPRLSQAAFMDLVVALQAQLNTPDATKILAAMPQDQREAALQLGVLSKNYVDLVEGRSSPHTIFKTASGHIGFDSMPTLKLQSIANCGVGFELNVAGRNLSELLDLAEAARKGNAHVVMIGLSDWTVPDIREIGLKAKGHVTAR